MTMYQSMQRVIQDGLGPTNWSNISECLLQYGAILLKPPFMQSRTKQLKIFRKWKSLPFKKNAPIVQKYAKRNIITLHIVNSCTISTYYLHNTRKTCTTNVQKGKEIFTRAVESRDRMVAIKVNDQRSRSSLLGHCHRYSLPSPRDSLNTAWIWNKDTIIPALEICLQQLTLLGLCPFGAHEYLWATNGWSPGSVNYYKLMIPE
jgi:hypothetical protein